MSPDSPHTLNSKQLVFVFMAATVVAVVVFLCGVMVGRGVQVRLAAEAAEAPLDPTTAAVLRVPSAVPRAPGELAPSVQENLSYPRRLEAPQTVNEPRLAPQSGSLRRPAASSNAGERRLERPEGGVAITVASYANRDAAEVVARRLASLGYPSYVSDSAPGGQPLFWVRVGDYPDLRRAEEVKTRLEREGQFRPVITP